MSQLTWMSLYFVDYRYVSVRRNLMLAERNKLLLNVSITIYRKTLFWCVKYIEEENVENNYGKKLDGCDKKFTV